MADQPETRWYAIVDTAQDDRLYDYVECCAEYQCLISGDVPRELATALPYLVHLGEGEPLTEAWRREGLGKNWGIAFESWASIDDLRIQFKKFLNAKLPDGAVVMFRFYDPRVFRTYILSAADEERAAWFQLTARYSIERENPQGFHGFHIENGCLFDDSRT